MIRFPPSLLHIFSYSDSEQLCASASVRIKDDHVCLSRSCNWTVLSWIWAYTSVYCSVAGLLLSLSSSAEGSHLQVRSHWQWIGAVAASLLNPCVWMLISPCIAALHTFLLADLEKVTPAFTSPRVSHTLYSCLDSRNIQRLHAIQNTAAKCWTPNPAALQGPT